MNHLEPYQVVGAMGETYYLQFDRPYWTNFKSKPERIPDSNFFEKSPKCMFYLGHK